MVVTDFVADMHYDTVASWWKGHNWPAIPIRHLPSRGYIVEDLAAGFLYSTDSSAAIMEWIVGNHKAPTRQVYKAIKALVKHMINVAEEDGYELVFTAIKVNGLQRLYEHEGFKLTDQGYNHMLWRRK